MYLASYGIQRLGLKAGAPGVEFEGKLLALAPRAARTEKANDLAGAGAPSSSANEAAQPSRGGATPRLWLKSGTSPQSKSWKGPTRAYETVVEIMPAPDLSRWEAQMTLVRWVVERDERASWQRACSILQRLKLLASGRLWYSERRGSGSTSEGELAGTVLGQ